MSDSIFTKIIRHEIPATVHYEDDDFIVISDIHPQAPVHVLLITKEPYTSLEAIPAENTELYTKIFVTIRKVVRQLGIDKDYRLVMNVGKHVQAIQHFHLHILGGWGQHELQEPPQITM